MPTYAKLRYRGLWPGIDLVVQGGGGRLKYELHLRPGARVKDIRLAYRGATELSLSAGGALRIGTPLGPMRDSPPVSYQVIAGRRVPVESRYRLDDRNENAYGFAIGAGYHPRRPLVIDPAVVYSTFLGGDSFERPWAITVDGAGSAYVTGPTVRSTFPTTPGAFDTTQGGSAAFVTKLNPAGSALAYSTYLGGRVAGSGRFADTSGTDLAVDAGGNAYVAGNTNTTDFPTTPGAYDTSFDGALDVFVTKLNATGSALSYSTYVGDSGFNASAGIALDAARNAYVALGTDASDFPTTPAAWDTSFNGGTDTIVTKLDAAGSGLSYSTYLGGAGADAASDIQVDPGGNAYVTGDTSSAGFPTTAGAYDTTFAGFLDVFAAKLNASGSSLSYSTYLGGGMGELGGGLALDPARNAYITGSTLSPDFPTTSAAYDRTFGGEFDAFVTKLNTAGSAISYSTFLGGAGSDFAQSIVVDSGGSAYVTGETGSNDFPTSPGSDDRTLNGFRDAFVTRLSAAGSELSYSTFLGGGDIEAGRDIALDARDSAYLAGETASADFPATAGAYDTSFNGALDAFITKLNPNQCSDGRDNDGDGKVDFPADPGCSSPSDDDERDARALPTSREQCKHDGWRAFGFRNQGQCVAFVQRGPKPPH
jgi:beta-propeller repeat-containing protein